MKRMQERYGLRETGVYVSGFNPFVDNVVLPLIYIVQKIRKGLAAKPLARLFAWGVNTWSKPGTGVVFINEATGWKGGRRLRVRLIAEHDDPYLFTAIPVVACLKQQLAGLLPPGVSMMGHAVDDGLMLAEMERLGVRIRTEISEIE